MVYIVRVWRNLHSIRYKGTISKKGGGHFLGYSAFNWKWTQQDLTLLKTFGSRSEADINGGK